MANTNPMLQLLKLDLQLTNTSNDTYLTHLIEVAKERIAEEGIVLTDGEAASDSLVIQYAAYLFRKRAGSETGMPRFLRYALNNRLFSQKGATNDV